MTQTRHRPALALIALLDRDPVQPEGVTIYEELKISREHKGRFATLLHRIVNRRKNLPLIRSGDPVAIAKLTKRFLREVDCRKFWPWRLFEIKHKWFRQL